MNSLHVDIVRRCVLAG